MEAGDCSISFALPHISDVLSVSSTSELCVARGLVSWLAAVTGMVVVHTSRPIRAILERLQTLAEMASWLQTCVGSVSMASLAQELQTGTDFACGCVRWKRKWHPARSQTHSVSGSTPLKPS